MNKEQDFYDADDFDIVDRWLKTFRKPKTRAGYSNDLLDFSRFLGHPLLGASRGDLDLYSEKMAKDGRNANTMRRALSALRSFYRYAYEEEMIDKNPALKLQLPTPKDSLNERIISESDFHKILAKEENPRNALLIELLYSTGGRISETLTVKWKDATDREEGGQIVYFGKREKTRTVLIPGDLWAKVKAQRGEASDDTYIFPSPKKEDGHLSASQAWRIVQKASLRAIGKKISPHWFRHAHASHAIDRGAPVSLVQETLGHADLRTTSRYVHARPNDSSSLYLPVK